MTETFENLDIVYCLGFRAWNLKFKHVWPKTTTTF